MCRYTYCKIIKGKKEMNVPSKVAAKCPDIAMFSSVKPKEDEKQEQVKADVNVPEQEPVSGNIEDTLDALAQLNKIFMQK